MKKFKKYLGLFVAVMVLSSLNSVDAQNRRCINSLNDNQKEQIKKIDSKYDNEMTKYRNQMMELRAKERTLMQTDKPDMKALYKNAESMSDLQKKLTALRMDRHSEVRAVMTPEQRLLMGNGRGKAYYQKNMRNCDGTMRRGSDMRKGNRQGNRRGNMQGMRQGMRKGDGTGMRQGNKAGRRYNKGICNQANCQLDLSDEQQEQFNRLKVAKLKVVNPWKNEMNELRARKRSLMNADNIDRKELDKVIGQMSDLRLKIQKENIRYRVERRKLLNDEQKAIFDNHRNRRIPNAKMGYGNRNYKCRF